MGSPPPVRGKASALLHEPCARRITPACAGKRYMQRCWRRGGRDHPRLCGEKSSGMRSRGTTIGSPPPVRGKASSRRACASSTGITPACAGKSCISARRQQPRRDHPRLCGEKSSRRVKSVNVRGSPPPVRGKDFHSNFVSYMDGITPACAGKRRHSNRLLHRRQDHPRLCGEKRCITLVSASISGSPPPVRGKDSAHLDLAAASGITPACAGKRPTPARAAPR